MRRGSYSPVDERALFGEIQWPFGCLGSTFRGEVVYVSVVLIDRLYAFLKSCFPFPYDSHLIENVPDVAS